MSIHRETTLPAAPERVYELLTDAVKFAAATGKPAEIGAGEGAAFSLFGDHVRGRLIELVPGQRVVQAWRFTVWAPGVYSIVQFGLSAAGAGTKLAVEHDAYPAEFHDHLSTNWPNFYFDPISKYFAG